MAQRVKRRRSWQVKNSSSPILTAIVSLYNSGVWLHNRINNLMRTNIYQRGQLLIYCVNAQSPDTQDDAIASSYAGVPNFHYEVVPFMTCYSAWNYAIRKTNSDFLTCANSDDIVSPDCYDILIEACKQNNAPLAYCGWYAVSQPNMRWEEVHGFWNHVSHYNPVANQMSCGHFPVWRRTIHDKIGLFDPSFQALGDADLFYRSWINNVRDFFPVDAPLGAYLWRDGQNLWHRTNEEKRSAEWVTLYSRKPGKLDF